MKTRLITTLAATLFLPSFLFAAEVRMVTYWSAEEIQEIKELGEKIQTELASREDNAETAALFQRYEALLNRGENILTFLSETIDLSDALAQGQKDVKTAGGEDFSMKDLENRVGYMYVMLLLRFDEHIERQLLQNLSQIALKSEDHYNRSAAVTMIGAMARPESLETLQAAAKDTDESVRSCANEAIERIQNPPKKMTYKDVLKMMDDLNKFISDYSRKEK